MGKKRGMYKLIAIIMSVILVMGVTPVSAIEEKSELPSGASGEIIAFEKLDAELGEQRVLLGTLETDLELPATLMATIQFKVSEDDGLLGSSELSPELDKDDTGRKIKEDSDTTIDIYKVTNADKDTNLGTAIHKDEAEEEKAGDKSGSVIEDGSKEDEYVERREDEPGRITIPLSVRWASSPVYDGEKAGEYLFRPEVPESFILTEDIEIPQIKVIVGEEGTISPLAKGFTLLSTDSGEAMVAGLGTEDNPLRIETAEQLAFFAWCWNNRTLPTSLPANPYLQMENDLDLSAYGREYDSGRGWLPIGTVSLEFTGTFDGNNKTITGLYINRSKQDYIGLFGFANKLKNIIIEGAVINGGNYVGSVVGGATTVENCISSATVSGQYYGVGGIAGAVVNLKNCVSSGTVSGGDYVGGIVGYVYSGEWNPSSFSIQNCVSSSIVTGITDVGGIVGAVTGRGVQNCVSSGDVSGEINYVGGIVGNAIGAPIQNCISSGGISGEYALGGIAGLGGGEGLVSINNCVALNSYIIGDSSLSRVFRGIGSENNYAYSEMKVNNEKISGDGAHDSMDGKSVGFDDIKTLWTTGGLSESWGNAGVWVLEEGKLPVLKDIPNQYQSNLLPVHIAGPGGFAGSGTDIDPYRIYTTNDLKKLADLVNDGLGHGAYYRLEADIDLSMYGKDYDGGKGWMPIGIADIPFEGIFDGNNKKITGLYINREQDNIGLFGYIDQGTVKNVVLVEGNVTGKNNVGGVAGRISDPFAGMLENCINTGSVSGSENVGGVAGNVSGISTIENWINTGNISGRENVGGVVGYTELATIKALNNSGRISGNNHVGGIVGYSKNGSGVEKCVNTGSIRAEGDQVGGVMGFNQAQVNACINKGTIRAAGDQVGGVVGANHGSVVDSINIGNVDGEAQVGGIAGLNIYTVEECVNTGSIIGQNQVGGIVGKGEALSGLENCVSLNSMLMGDDNLGRIVGFREDPSKVYLYNNYAYANMKINEEILAGGAADDKNGASVEIDDIKNLWTKGGLNGSWNTSTWTLAEGKLPVLKGIPDQSDLLPVHIAGLEGSGTEGDPYRIDSAETLKYMADSVNSDIHNQYANKHFRLEYNIDLSVYGEDYDGGNGWIPIGSTESPFGGIFDGNNKTITGLFINRTDVFEVGLFGYVKNGMFKNLTIEGASINGKSFVGALAGYVESGTVENCVNTGSFSGEGTHVGGIVGYIQSGTVKSCISRGSISVAGTYLGGIVGYVEESAVENCLNSASITGTNAYVGGVVGYVEESAVESCINTASITGTNTNVGGVVGYVEDGTVRNCISMVNIGGVNAHVGGIVGYVQSGTVESCISTASVTGTNTNAGGVVGYVEDGRVEYCASLGQSINGTTCGRVTSKKKGALLNNFALSTIKLKGKRVSGSQDDLNGADANIAILFKGSFWQDTMNMDETVWSIGENRLPYLKALSEYRPSLSSNAFSLPTPDAGDIILTAVPDAMAKSAEALKVIITATGDFQNTMWPQLTWEANGGSLTYVDTFAYELTVPADFTGTITVTVKLISFPYLPGKSVAVQVNGDLEGTVTVDGSYRIGQTLTANILNISDNPGALSYQWMRGDGPISGATNESYILTEEDLGEIVSVCITAKHYLDKIQSEGQTVRPIDITVTPSQPKNTITVAEVSSKVFKNAAGAITAEANIENAFSNFVEIKVTDTQEDAASFKLSVGDKVFPFDISIYIKGTNEKTKPKPGHAVTISLPIPGNLLDEKKRLAVMHKSESGVVTEIASRLLQKDGVWYLVFEATEFSPYALVVRYAERYDEKAGVPYYIGDNGNKVFIGFAAKGRYTAPEGKTVSVMRNSKSFIDIAGHWAAGYIGFVTERELFVGTGSGNFSPDTGMTRAMLATVIGRLYERSNGEINTSGTQTFTDCDYDAYYGKYIAWAMENGIIGGYGNGKFGPNDQITREQMVSILFRFADFLGVIPANLDTVLDYPDADNISNYAKTAALYCQTTGIIAGRPGGVFAPQETATRAEVAAIIQRFVEAVLD